MSKPRAPLSLISETAQVIERERIPTPEQRAFIADGARRGGRKKDPHAKRDTWEKRSVYLRPEMSKQAGHAMVDQGCDLSDLIDRALAAFLGEPGQPRT